MVAGEAISSELHMNLNKLNYVALLSRAESIISALNSFCTDQLVMALSLANSFARDIWLLQGLRFRV